MNYGEAPQQQRGCYNCTCNHRLLSYPSHTTRFSPPAQFSKNMLQSARATRRYDLVFICTSQRIEPKTIFWRQCPPEISILHVHIKRTLLTDTNRRWPVSPGPWLPNPWPSQVVCSNSVNCREWVTDDEIATTVVVCKPKHLTSWPPLTQF